MNTLTNNFGQVTFADNHFFVTLPNEVSFSFTPPNGQVPPLQPLLFLEPHEVAKRAREVNRRMKPAFFFISLKIILC